jgi:signal transduction histidine kinase/transcriptional regulator with XRE-family HTH domain
VAPVLSADFADELRAARRRVSILEEANRAIQDSIDRITRLATFSQGLDRSVSIEDVAGLLFEEVRGILPQEVMLLALVDAAGHEFRPVSAEPADMAAPGRRELEAQCASGMVGWAIGVRRPTTVPAAHLGANLVLVPLATARRTVGILMVGTPLAVDAIEQQHLTLAAVVARQAAECIDNIWLAEDVRRRNEAGRLAAEAAAARRVADLGLLVETAGALSAERERDAALRFLVEATCRHLGVTTATISIVGPDGRLATSYSAGLPGPGVDPPRCGAEEQCPLDWVAEHRTPLAIARTRDDPRARACAVLRAAGAVSFLGVPLVARDRTIGVLSVMTDHVREFTAEEVALLTGLAAQGASAIENARLFADVQGRMEQQQQALARLVQSAHLASVGLLAGGVAHDINNPLCIISNHLQLLRLRTAALPPDLEAALAPIETSVSRIAASIEALLEYAQIRPGDRRRTDLNEVMRRILILMTYHPLCRRLSVETAWGEGLPAVNLDRAAWEQVVLELIANSREAMAEGGRVHIRTRHLGTRPDAAGARVPWVEVVVEDEGRGIAPEEIARIFDPFFTTKESKRGMGIGLKICRDIVHEHGGVLRVEGGMPVGTRVVIELPGVSGGPQGGVSDVAGHHHDHGGTEKGCGGA